MTPGQADLIPSPILMGKMKLSTNTHSCLTCSIQQLPSGGGTRVEDCRRGMLGPALEMFSKGRKLEEPSLFTKSGIFNIAFSC